jgi:23S rRNA (pseudouridine1915-N3)-methyltransferase
LRILIAAVGKARRDSTAELVDAYAARIHWPISFREVEFRKALPASQLKVKEAELLLAAVPPEATVIALDERGVVLTSGDFARRLGAWRDAGTSVIAFLIGGADGHGQAVLDRADLILSLGRMTWPHLLVRGMLAEQIYRAQQILAGHPYHRR